MVLRDSAVLSKVPLYLLESEHSLLLRMSQTNLSTKHSSFKGMSSFLSSSLPALLSYIFHYLYRFPSTILSQLALAAH